MKQSNPLNDELRTSIIRGSPEDVVECLRRGADLEHPNAILMLASEFPDVPACLKALISEGALVDAQNKSG